MIDDRRLVGIDLGIASDHTVRVLDGHGGEVCRRRAHPTVDGLAAVKAAALTAAAAGTRLEVVIDPTGPAWLPIAVFFTSRGRRVLRVASTYATTRAYEPGLEVARIGYDAVAGGVSCPHCYHG